MKTHLFKLECLTDMHVGSGEANYSVIDNEVQKDTVLKDVPVIHASGVKGALKEHFEIEWGIDDSKIKRIFGDKDNAGSYKFLSALCVARPLRVSSGDMPYVLCSAEDILKSFSALLEGLGMSEFYNYSGLAFDDNKKFVSAQSVEIEGEECKVVENLGDAFAKLGLDNLAVAKTLRDYDLPVRARNVLDENGQSKNLWYEELVPHKSVFYFAVIVPDGKCELEFRPTEPVQFGGNASVGNGYTTITEVTLQ